MAKFTHSEKKDLANKISKISNNDDLKYICNIIKKDSTFDSMTSATENSNGIFMYFHKLEDKTYEELNSYINSIKANSLLEVSSDEKKSYMPYKYDEYELKPSDGQKLKYSNKEKTLLKRKKYEQETPSDNDFVIIG